MGTTARVTAAFFSVFALSAAQAEGATTYSPPVRSSDGDVLGCVVQNLRGEDVAVSAELNNGFDSVVESGTVDIPSGQVRTVVFTTTSVFGAYCVFTFDGVADSVRGFVQVVDIGGSNTRLLYPASEAPGTSTDPEETVSPPVRSSDGDVLSCVAQNLSAEAVQIEAEIRSSQGAIVTSGTLNVAAGRVQTVAFTTSAVFGAYCRFQFEAHPQRVRGYVQLMDLGGSNTRLLYPAADTSLGRPFDDARTVSPPVRSSDGDVLACWVQNLGDEAVEVDVEINNGLNTIVDSGTQSIPAGGVQSVASTTSAVFGAYCAFEFDGNPSTLRGYAQLYDLGGSNTRLLYPAGRPNQHIDTFSGPISSLPLLASTGAVLSGSTTLVAPLRSPPVRSSDGDVLSCIVQNLSDEAVDVEARIDNGLDTIVTSNELSVPAGRVLTVAFTTTPVFGAFCQFDIAGRATNVRGFAQLMDIGGSNTRLLYGASAPLVVVPVPTPSPSHTAAVDPTASPTHTATVDPTISVTPSSPTPTATPTHTATVDPTISVTPSSPTPTASPTHTATVDPTISVTPSSSTPTASPTHTATVDPTISVSPSSPTPTASPTHTATVDPTISVTPSSPTPTASPTHTATVDPTISVSPSSPTPTATTDPTTSATPGPCVGDCDGNGSVSISELVTMVNIALGNRQLADCIAGDRDDNAVISISELIAAVNNALNGCP